MQHADSDVVRDAVRHLCMSFGTDLACDLFMALVDSNDESAVLKLKNLDPSGYTSAETFSKDYLLAKILSKWKGLGLPNVNRKNTAIRSWVASERQNAITNERIRQSRIHGITDPMTLAVMMAAKRKIAEIIGPFSFARVLSGCRWGPGGTLDLSRRAGLDRKLTPPFSVTARALPYARLDLESDRAWLRHCFNCDIDGPVSLWPRMGHPFFTVVDEGLHLTVDKDAGTDRNIEKQPTLNGWLQQGVGRDFRLCLRRSGIDLDDQSLNQMLARLGQAFRFSTLDLKGASDSTVTELVYELFSVEWANYLCDLRVPYTKVKGIRVRTEKIASMGNAYSFELETLIFYALAWAVAHVRDEPPLVQVYGDDIICLEEHAADLIKVLAFAGYTTNDEKSFISGRFRESCGKHYFDGVDVTPFYLKKTDGSWPEIVRFANRLSAWSYRFDDTWRSDVVSRAWRCLYDSIDHARRPAVPLGYQSDDGFKVPKHWLGNYDANHGYLCRVLSFRSKTRKARRGALYPVKLRFPQYSNPSPKGLETIDTGKGRYTLRFKRIPLSSIS